MNTTCSISYPMILPSSIQPLEDPTSKEHHLNFLFKRTLSVRKLFTKSEKNVTHEIVAVHPECMLSKYEFDQLKCSKKMSKIKWVSKTQWLQDKRAWSYIRAKFASLIIKYQFSDTQVPSFISELAQELQLKTTPSIQLDTTWPRRDISRPS